jgi:hypothetical protein
MGDNRESPFDPFCLESLRLPDSMIGVMTPKRRPPRHRPGDPFIKGPIPYAWIASACRLPGVGLHVAMAYRLHAKRFGFSHGRHWGIADIAKGMRVGRDTARRGLHAAELAGLVSVSRAPGRKPAVSILDLAGPGAGPTHRPLYGPIPWAWWLPASRLPGKSLPVAAVCWLLAGRERSAEFELALDGWAEFGLSRFSASRGLDTLAGAGLVSAVRRPGRSPVVSILDPTAGPGPDGRAPLRNRDGEELRWAQRSPD